MIGFNLNICTVHRIPEWRDNLSEADNCVLLTTRVAIILWTKTALLGFQSRDYVRQSSDCSCFALNEYACNSTVTKKKIETKREFESPLNQVPANRGTPEKEPRIYSTTQRTDKTTQNGKKSREDLSQRDGETLPEARREPNPDSAARAVRVPPWPKTAEIARRRK